MDIPSFLKPDFAVGPCCWSHSRRPVLLGSRGIKHSWSPTRVCAWLHTYTFDLPSLERLGLLCTFFSSFILIYLWYTRHWERNERCSFHVIGKIWISSTKYSFYIFRKNLVGIRVGKLLTLRDIELCVKHPGAGTHWRWASHHLRIMILVESHDGKYSERFRSD